MSELNIDETNGASRAPAVARAATVLRVLAGQRSGLGVTDIARRAGIVPSTCLHVLRALVYEGFVNFDNEKKTYRTGIGLLTLAREAMTSNEFPTLVQPILDDLVVSYPDAVDQRAGQSDRDRIAAYPVTAVASELDSRERMVAVAISRSDSLISLHVNVGSRFPAFVSATGRCVAAASGLSKDQLRVRFDALRWERAPRFEDWYADLQQTRAEGVGVDRGTYVRGVTIMATLLPVGADGSVRGIALIGFDHHMTERVSRQLKINLKSAAEAAAARLT